ncbi:hypothetical protein L6452_13517 [Arctium lappa]|uniref:Uncharacterized protein n=1 Tax=Arctium lappa TaxID=4217 RepID=A0ACB9CID8_ARCLA|nr:hypothetical protein L6452_13517 [Arctium lappa]
MGLKPAGPALLFLRIQDPISLRISQGISLQNLKASSLTSHHQYRLTDHISDFISSPLISDFISSDGMVVYMDNVYSLLSLPNEEGRDPDNLVSARPRTIRFWQFPISSGIFPTRSLFPPAWITSRFCKRPISAGIFPVSRLSNRTRFLRLRQFQSSRGISPVIKLEFKIKSWRFSIFLLVVDIQSFFWFACSNI